MFSSVFRKRCSYKCLNLSSCCRLFRHRASILLVQSTVSQRPALSNSDLEQSFCALWQIRSKLEQPRRVPSGTGADSSSHFERPVSLSLSLSLPLPLLPLSLLPLSLSLPLLLLLL